MNQKRVAEVIAEMLKERIDAVDVHIGRRFDLSDVDDFAADAARRVFADAKRTVLAAVIEVGMMTICVDSRVDGVIVPDEHKGNPGLLLNLGYNLPRPIPDLTLGPDAITATLDFHGRAFHVTIPWHTIWRVRTPSGDTLVWAENVPEDVLAAAQQPEPEKPARPKLSLVPPADENLS